MYVPGRSREMQHRDLVREQTVFLRSHSKNSVHRLDSSSQQSSLISICRAVIVYGF